MKRKVFGIIALVVFIGVVAGGWHMFNEIFPKAKPIRTPKIEEISSISVAVNNDEESPKHQYLAHPARGWLTIGEGLESFSVMIMMWFVQAIVLWAIAFLCFVMGKLKSRTKES